MELAIYSAIQKLFEQRVSKATQKKRSLEINLIAMDEKQFTELYARLREENPTKRLDFSGIVLKGVSFEACGEYQLYFQLSNLTFHNADLSNTDGDHMDIENCDFTGANLSGIDLLQSSFTDCDLTNTNLSYARLSEVGFANTKLNNTNFSYAQLNDVYLPNKENLGPIDLSYAFVSALCGVDSTSRSRIKLYKTLYLSRNAGWIKDLEDGNQSIELSSGANLQGVHLVRANLSDEDLSDSDFSNANLKRSVFYSANLTNCNFTGADLESADFSNANLVGANFSNANLTNARFQSAQIADICLEGATLQNTNFENTSLAIGLANSNTPIWGD